MVWIIGIVSYVAGVLSGYAIKLSVDVRTRKSVRSPVATAEDGSIAQSGNVAGGHIAGGNIHTKTK